MHFRPAVGGSGAAGGGDAFVTAFNPAGSALVYSSYLGADNSNTGEAITLDSAGSVYVAGHAGTSFPTTANAFRTTVPSSPYVFVTKLPAVGAGAPAITPGGVVPIYSSATTIQPGSWISIFGSNLAAAPATWNNDFPTTLGGTSVTIDNKAAYLWYVSPTQINLQAPDDTTTGAVNVVVTTASGSVTSTVTLGVLGPSLSVLDGKHVAGIILRSNGSGSYGNGSYDIIGPTGTALGYRTVAAKAGDVVELFGVGFGPTNPQVPAGKAFSGSAATTNTVNLTIGNALVIPSFSGLSSAGLYQLNVTIPAGLGTGDVPLVATVAGAQTQPGVVIALQ